MERAGEACLCYHFLPPSISLSLQFKHVAFSPHLPFNFLLLNTLEKYSCCWIHIPSKHKKWKVQKPKKLRSCRENESVHQALVRTSLPSVRISSKRDVWWVWNWCKFSVKIEIFPLLTQWPQEDGMGSPITELKSGLFSWKKLGENGFQYSVRA